MLLVRLLDAHLPQGAICISRHASAVLGITQINLANVILQLRPFSALPYISRQQLSEQIWALSNMVPQLLRKVFVLVIIVPALLPQVCIPSRYLALFLCPIYSTGGSAVVARSL